MPGWKTLKTNTLVGHRFQFRRHDDAAVGPPPNVQRDDPHVITDRDEGIVSSVVQDKTKHSFQFIQRRGDALASVLQVQRQNTFAIGTGTKRVLDRLAQRRSQFQMVVNFTVDRQGQFMVGVLYRVAQRLFTGFRVDDGQTFVGDRTVLNHFHTRPVRASVAEFFGLCRGRGGQHTPRPVEEEQKGGG